MRRTQNDEFKRIRKERIEEIGKCELCGSKRGLQLHHCVPDTCGGKDTEENLILICAVCHTKLTPNGELTSRGIKNRRIDWIVKTVLEEKINFYNEVESCLERNGNLKVSDVMDIYDKINFEMENEILKEYRKIKGA